MGYIDPTREQFKTLYGLPLGQPAFMINLLRFRDQAAYRPEDPEAHDPIVSGKEAYGRYSVEAEAVLSAQPSR